MSTIVDEIVRQIVSRQAIDWNTHRLKSLASKAVPILLEYLDHPVERYRKVAFYGLQYCWNDDERDLAIQRMKGEGKESSVNIQRYKGLGEIEKYINIKVLIKEKMNKQSEFVNFKNGNYTPLK